MHRMNDSEMLTEIIRELAKSDGNTIISSKHMLTWAKDLKCKETRQQSLTACMSVMLYYK